MCRHVSDGAGCVSCRIPCGHGRNFHLPLLNGDKTIDTPAKIPPLCTCLVQKNVNSPSRNQRKDVFRSLLRDIFYTYVEPNVKRSQTVIKRYNYIYKMAHINIFVQS